MSSVVANLSREITTLAGAGGKSFLVLNLPKVGETPYARANGVRNYANGRAAQFNSLLPGELDQLEATLGIQIFRLDVFALTQRMREDPGAFGLSNLTDPALTTTSIGTHTIVPMPPTIVPVPDQYFFWDITHMTRAAHRHLGDAAGQLVWAEALPVEGDVKPWNEIDPRQPFSRGVIPVAILGSESFDVNDIDVTTLAFGPDGASPAGSRSVIRDLNGDGFLDLLAKYRTEESGISPGDPGACLRGALLDGTAFEGSDAIRIVPPR